VAGQNKLLKANEILFKQGDPASVMYIVRKGSLRVFFPKGNEEVTVAMLKDGAVVGEMAFFDDKPRSASVKAAEDTDVTVISKADFDKLLTQVPKWMVTMMQSLVGRLRDTNTRLQALEASQGKAGGAAGGANVGGGVIMPNQKHPFQHVHRAMLLLMLSFAKDGAKDGKDAMLERDQPTKLWKDFSGEDQMIFDKTIEILQRAKFVAIKPNSLKVPSIFFVNRGMLSNFIEYFGKTARGFQPLNPFLSPAALEVFGAMVDEVSSSGYETLSIGMTEFLARQTAKEKDTSKWLKAIAELVPVVPELKVGRNGNDVMVKVLAKEHKLFLSYLRYMQMFNEANLA
jgi:CRP-like cAMP-binding protein